VSRILDIKNVDAALKRAANRAMTGTRHERAGRFLREKKRGASLPRSDNENTLHLQSSMITSIRYDEDACELDVTFLSGKTYRYLNVPLDVYIDLLDAESKGAFFNDTIKDAFAVAEARSRRKR
jgi:hypothetical protein